MGWLRIIATSLIVIGSESAFADKQYTHFCQAKGHIWIDNKFDGGCPYCHGQGRVVDEKYYESAPMTGSISSSTISAGDRYWDWRNKCQEIRHKRDMMFRQRRDERESQMFGAALRQLDAQADIVLQTQGEEAWLDYMTRGLLRIVPPDLTAFRAKILRTHRIMAQKIQMRKMQKQQLDGFDEWGEETDPLDGMEMME